MTAHHVVLDEIADACAYYVDHEAEIDETLLGLLLED